MKKNSKKISLIVSIVLFALFCATFIFLYKKINSNDQKALETTQIWQTEARRRDQIRALDASIQRVAGDRAALETHFARSSDVVPFFDTMEKLAPEVKAVATIESVNAGTSKTGLIVGLRATGSFEALYKFLTLLENSPYELAFVSMDMHVLTAGVATGKNKSNAKWEAVFQIQLLTFTPS